MEDILRKFCGVSGQKVNMAKSKLYVSHNINKAMKLTINTEWGISLTADLDKYLGVLYLI